MRGDITNTAYRHRHARTLLIALLTLSTGCAMRVTGVVRDGSTRLPIGGAVLMANDGRNRASTTDPNGQYAVKTDWRPATIVVSAPGYSTTTVTVPDRSRFPVIDVDLERAVQSATGVPVVDQSVAVKLGEIHDLHERGIISDDEYQRARNRVIEGL